MGERESGGFSLDRSGGLNDFREGAPADRQRRDEIIRPHFGWGLAGGLEEALRHSGSCSVSVLVIKNYVNRPMSASPLIRAAVHSLVRVGGVDTDGDPAKAK